MDDARSRGLGGRLHQGQGLRLTAHLDGED